MSVVDLLRGNEVVTNYFSGYTKAQKPEAVLHVLLYGIHTLHLHYESTLPLDKLKKLTSRAKTLIPMREASIKIAKQIKRTAQEIKEIDRIVERSISPIDVEKPEPSHRRRNQSFSVG
jgi:hypothetical protein